jgi:hypothetical protein
VAWAQFTATIAQCESSERRGQPGRLIRWVLEADYEDYLRKTYENARNDLVLEKKTISMKLANNRDLYKRILDTYGKDKNSIPFLAITPYLDEGYQKIQMELLEIEKKLSPNKTMPAHYLQKPVLPTAPLTPKINPLIFGFSILGFILVIFYLLVRLSFSLNTHR